MTSEGSTTSAKVAEIFLTASAAFQKLGELTLQFNMPSSSQNSAHWTEKEVELLRGALQKFSNDLDNIAEVVKLRTGNQIRVDYKRKALDIEYSDHKTLPVVAPAKRKALTPAIPAKRHALPSEARRPMPVMRPTPLVQQEDSKSYPDYMASLLSPNSPDSF